MLTFPQAPSLFYMPHSLLEKGNKELNSNGFMEHQNQMSIKTQENVQEIMWRENKNIKLCIPYGHRYNRDYNIDPCNCG